MAAPSWYHILPTSNHKNQTARSSLTTWRQPTHRHRLLLRTAPAPPSSHHPAGASARAVSLMTPSARPRNDGGTVRPNALAALSPFSPHTRSAISAILRNVNTRRRFASGSFAISASVSAIVVPYA